MVAAEEGEEEPVARSYAVAPPAPRIETKAEADARSMGCKSCHTTTDALTMHNSTAVVLGCADCHGGDASVKAEAGLAKTDPADVAERDKEHVIPR